MDVFDISSSFMNWPYVVTEVLQLGAYKLKTIDSEVFTNAWNIEQLCHFYP